MQVTELSQHLLNNLFIIIVFKLKALEIYLTPENDTQEKIKKQLWRLGCLRALYLVFISLISLLWTFMEQDFGINAGDYFDANTVLAIADGLL